LKSLLLLLQPLAEFINMTRTESAVRVKLLHWEFCEGSMCVKSIARYFHLLSNNVVAHFVKWMVHT